MFCYKCGKQACDTSVFCYACGTRLLQSVSAAPSEYEPLDASKPKPPLRPYKTEYVLGLVGSMLGAVVFLIILIVGIKEVLSSFALLYDNGIDILVSSLFALASFILGFIGIAPLKRGRWTGGILLTIGGAIGIIAIIVGSYVGWITVFSFPLILAGGIVALSRRSFVERSYPQV